MFGLRLMFRYCANRAWAEFNEEVLCSGRLMFRYCANRAWAEFNEERAAQIDRGTKATNNRFGMRECARMLEYVLLTS